jgi:integrase
LLEALSEYIKPFFVVAYHLGMRTGELLALKRTWVHLEEGLIYVNGRVTKKGDPKTAPIYGHGLLAGEDFEGGPRAIAEMRLALLPERKANPQLQRRLGAGLRSLGRPRTSVPRLRRTAVRNMIRAGVPEKVAMQISGHKTASMLWRCNITDARDIKEAGQGLRSTSKAKEAERYGLNYGVFCHDCS